MAFLTAWIPLSELVRIALRGTRARSPRRQARSGTAAVQIVRALNGHPVAAVGSAREARAPALARRGRGGHLRGHRRASTRSSVVFDLVGGDVFTALARPPEADGHGDRRRLRGRDVAGGEPRLARRPQHRRPRLLPRTSHRPRPGARRPRRAGRPRASGRVAPSGRSSAHELPLEEAAEAHRLIESRQSTGKVVLIP